VNVLIDDQLLGRVLRGDVPEVLIGAELFTTGYWYVRLCQAALSTTDHPGALSGPIQALPAERRASAIAAVLALPDEIGLLSLRTLGPVIGQLRQHYELNILAIEVLAAARQLDASVFLSVDSPRLTDALVAEGLVVSVV
jgi:hypothetical protein